MVTDFVEKCRAIPHFCIYHGYCAITGKGRLKMNPAKQHRKLHKLLSRAEVCLTRDEAQKILKKAAKTQRKLEQGPSAVGLEDSVA